MGMLHRISLALVIIGALNWGLIGFFQFDLVATLFGGQNAVISRIVYALVGLSGLVCLGLLFRRDDIIETEPGQNFETLNYNTEFGEEHDFTKERGRKALTDQKDIENE